MAGYFSEVNASMMIVQAAGPVHVVEEKLSK
jgi:hypothetical protein